MKLRNIEKLGAFVMLCFILFTLTLKNNDGNGKVKIARARPYKFPRMKLIHQFLT